MRAHIVVYLLALGPPTLAVSACATASRPDEVSPQLTEAPGDSEILYDAIVTTFRERNISTAVASAETGVVVGAWESLNSELRRRYIARAVSPGRGLMLKVIVEFERVDRTGPEPVWRPAEDELTTQRARREENDLGTAIQAVFNQRRDRR